MSSVYYPQAIISSESASTHPKATAPIYDELSCMPLEPFSNDDSGSSEHKHDIPPRPKSFDGYLYPRLTRNERLRLTMLWYYTRNLLQDTETLSRIREKVEIVKTFTGWEFAICGLISNDIFQRIAAIGMPLANLPRRESPCAHTIQAAGVLYVPDMIEDWRFVKSPQVCYDGLRSYAGTRLQCRVDDQDVALGSLCVASKEPNKELSQAQMDTLIKFANMLADDIVRGAQQKRARQQLHNDTLLRGHQDTDSILKVLKNAYPRTEVDIVAEHPGDTIWEDDKFIDELLRTMNHTKLISDKPVRAVLGKVRERFLVVSTNDPAQVFDDVDVRFVQSCAAAISNNIQEEELQSALNARFRFMRGVTHQLRTPIHGILGSVALLIEEGNRSEGLTMIRDSGLELMATVNNLIKFSQSSIPRETSLQDLAMLEVDILEDIHWLPVSGVSILFNNKILGKGVTTDLTSIRDCLQLLVQNAVHNTSNGSIVITISSSNDYSSLVFDIQDTGCGVPLADHQRIFDAYEKVNLHSNGAGLGLTLACKIADALDGTVTLVSSVPDEGSHFRAEFQNPGFCSFRTTPVTPHSFFVVKSKPCVLVDHFVLFLKGSGWREDGNGEVAVVPFKQQLEHPKKDRVAISLVPIDMAANTKAHPNIHFFSGPFTSLRLREILNNVDDILMSRTIPPQRDLSQTFKPKCLLVDDNDINLRILCHFCDKRQYTYSVARDGHEAFEEYKRERPDLVLLDLQMPRRDGILACADIRAFEVHEGLPPAKVFIITGQDTSDDRQRSFAAGADKFYVKPLVLRNLDRGVLTAFNSTLRPE